MLFRSWLVVNEGKRWKTTAPAQGLDGVSVQEVMVAHDRGDVNGELAIWEIETE